MADLSSREQPRKLVYGHKLSCKVLAAIKRNRMPQLAAFHENCVARIIHNGGIGVDLAQEMRSGSFVTRLFPQLTNSSGHRRDILGVHDPAGDLEFDRGSPMAKLLDEHYFFVRSDRDDIHP